MRERLDCAVLSTAGTDEWVDHWVKEHINGRLHVHVLMSRVDDSTAGSCHLLAQAAMRLRRFDACLLPVSEQNLAWVRTTLQTAHGVVRTPVVALVNQLKAAALNDLYTLGLADFIRMPFCSEELRVRVERLLEEQRWRSSADNGRARLHANGQPSYTVSEKAAANKVDERSLCASILDRTGFELDAFAAASASRCATSKESFRSAKSKVIERFERAYITAALGRHSGNIAMAARAAQKHRRAFWALMRKHQIDAAPFRGEPNSPDGRSSVVSPPHKPRDG